MNEPSEDARVMLIDRSKQFHPMDLIGGDWTLRRQDEQSLALSQIDPASIRLKDMLEPSEILITGEERIRRLKGMNYVPLDAQVFLAFWKNPHLIPPVMKESTNGKNKLIYFDESELLLRHRHSANAIPYTLFMYNMGQGWEWYVRTTGSMRGTRSPSAVISLSSQQEG